MELQKADEKGLLTAIRDSVIVTPKFKEALQNIAFNIGIRTALELNELDTIFNFISRNFGSINLKGIIEAFDLYSGQKLDFKESHFNSFDNVFIGKVLNSYVEKENKERAKPKEFTKEKKIEWQMWEKKKHFEWLKNDVFLSIDGKYGKSNRGYFPAVLICSWLDVYEHMISERILNEKMGTELKERIIEAERIERSLTKKEITTVVSDGRNNTNIPSCFYELEVREYFKTNFK